MAIVIATALPDASVIPDVDEVARVIPRRATDGDGLAAGTFTSSTVPNAAQVEGVAQSYANDVVAALGGTIPVSLRQRARDVAALGAAAQIELSFFPEDRDTIADRLFARYDKALTALVASDEQVTGQPDPAADGGDPLAYAGSASYRQSYPSGYDYFR